MAELCRFLGIIIAMFADDHNPPHLHVQYGDYEATITLKDYVVKGAMPRKELKKIFKWMEDNHEDLMNTGKGSRMEKKHTKYKLTKNKHSMENLDLIRVIDVDYIGDYTLKLTFSNGESRIVDFLPLFKTKLHEPLKELNNFVQFGLNHWTLEWYNGVDFAPDYLYEHGKAA